jgi:hypothetical protein
MIEIQSREGTGVTISQATAELSGLFRIMLEEEEQPAAVVIPMPWSLQDVKQVTRIMQLLAEHGPAALATQLLPPSPSITTQLAQAHELLQLLDFADVRPAVDLLHAFILRTLATATTVDEVLKMWMGPLTYASLDPAEQHQAYETCLTNFDFGQMRGVHVHAEHFKNDLPLA